MLVLAACGLHEDHTLTHDGLDRIYRVHLREEGVPADLPVVLYLHGGGGNRKTAAIDGLDAYAEELGFLLVAPQSLSTEGGLGNGNRWNGGSWEGGTCCGEADDVGFIARVIDDVVERYQADASRVYVTGISNGGLMTNRVGCELSEEIAAIATVAPAALLTDCVPTAELPVLDIHGTEDPCNLYDGSQPTNSCADSGYVRMGPEEMVDAWSEINDCSDTPVVTEVGTLTTSDYDCARGELRFIGVEEMGHTWPDGAQYLPAGVVGPVSTDISTGDIWSFFADHSRL